jgi:hypothetical protein
LYPGQFSVSESVSKGTVSDLRFRFRECLEVILLMLEFVIVFEMRLALALEVLGLLVVVQSRKSAEEKRRDRIGKATGALNRVSISANSVK